jgi:hypothetical protein
MAIVKQYALAPDTKLRLVAIHKESFITFEKFITYAEWVNFIKHKDYYYLTYKI